MNSTNTSTFTPAAAAPRSAIALYAQASSTFADKLAASEALLRQAAAHAPATQASSLGAEDMVITHLINALQLPIGICRHQISICIAVVVGSTNGCKAAAIANYL